MWKTATAPVHDVHVHDPKHERDDQPAHEGNFQIEEGQRNAILVDDLDPAEVAELSHQLWIERGCPIGSPEQDWFRAEEELSLRYQA
jgi:hypothetical protein